MEGTKKDSIGYEAQAAAPFVEKTYAMVNDPRTDSLILWGKKNNSFLVLSPNEFSQFLLPYYFRHSNFSSFVRQLNTYGFRKVDPDRWEFAHQSFLRDQIHLLPRIIRRTKRAHAGLFACSSSSEKEKGTMEGEVDEMLLQELFRLRQEQRALEEELQVMSKRLKATERRPHQMMSFLAKIADDPRSLSRLVISKQQQQSSTAAKKRRLIVSPPPPPPPPPAAAAATQLDDGLFLPSILVPGIQQTMFEPLDHGSDQLIMEEVKPFALITDVSAINSYDAELISPNSASEISFLPEFGMTGSETAAAEANFPFSLLGHGLY